MTASSLLPAPNLMPLLRYRELADAMGWLEQAFGFEKQIAVADGDGQVIYGQMTYRGSLMMMGAVRDTDLDKLMRQPDEVGGIETQSCYVVVDDADVHYARAQEQGAEIVLELKSDGLGRRGYSCRDPEGHIWNFGTYNPAKGMTMTVAGPAAEVAAPAVDAPRRPRRWLMSLVALMVACGAAGWWYRDDIRTQASAQLAAMADTQAVRDAERAYAELVKVRAEMRKAEDAAAAAKKTLDSERSQRVAIETRSGTTADALAQERNAREAAEAQIAALRDELKRKQDALEDAVESKRVSEEKLAVKTAETEKKETPAAAKTQAQAKSSNGIETSATRAADAEPKAPAVTSSAKAQANETPQVQKPARTPHRAKKSTAQRSSGPVATYVTGLHNVPWPYDTWNK